MTTQYEKFGKNIPSLNSLIKISIGLIIVAIISSAFVYAETSSVAVDGVSYDVNYTGDGVTVSGITADPDFVSIVIGVDVTGSPGILEITLDRSFFDAKFQGNDDSFIVLADGDESTFSETATTAQSRTLSIELPTGTEEVEIIGSVFGSTVTEEPVTETPVTEEPIVEEPVTETPVTEKPVTEKPVTEKPVTEKPKVECGVGTILKDGECVLDERCGPGTVLQDGVCVAEPVTETGPVRGLSTQLGVSVIAGFIIAGTVGLVLAIMSKASKSKK